MNRLFRLLLIFTFFTISLAEESHAILFPVPTPTPWLTPSVEVRRDIRPRIQKFQRVQKERKIETSESAIQKPTYTQIYTGSSLEIYEDTVNHVSIQKIYLSSGARLETFSDFDSYDSLTGEPLYTKFSPLEKWKGLRDPPFTIINGQFFDPRRIHTPFSFWFSKNWVVLTAWADNRNEEKNIFSYSSGSGASILPYTWENFRNEKSDFSLVNLSMDEPHHPDELIGRTYLCTLDPDTEWYSRTLIILSFQSATETSAAEIIRSWWCRDEYVSKLDASGSAIFGYSGTISYGYSRKWTPDKRKIPQIIGVYEN
jgi:hypothetical protein